MPFRTRPVASPAPRSKQPPRKPTPRDTAFRKARTCYDHLAGEAGVAVYEGLVKRKAIVTSGDSVTLTPAGRRLFAALGIDTDSLARQRRAFCKTCLDWSERRPHLARALGSALLAAFEGRGRVRRSRGSRVVRVKGRGRKSWRDGWGDSDPHPRPLSQGRGENAVVRLAQVLALGQAVVRHRLRAHAVAALVHELHVTVGALHLQEEVLVLLERGKRHHETPGELRPGLLGGGLARCGITITVWGAGGS
ncbi:MAG: hypothetical protein KF738_13655, partial [Burkholderiales bacterium]|nr:hypothetical protein [Burkholderiales bacterium]